MGGDKYCAIPYIFGRKVIPLVDELRDLPYPLQMPVTSKIFSLTLTFFLLFHSYPIFAESYQERLKRRKLINEGKANSTKIQMQSIARIFDDFRRKCRAYPNSIAQLKAPPVGCKFKYEAQDPKLVIIDGNFKDRFGNPFSYQKAGRLYLLRSMGINKKTGPGFNEDDICSYSGKIRGCKEPFPPQPSQKDREIKKALKLPPSTETQIHLSQTQVDQWKFNLGKVLTQATVVPIQNSQNQLSHFRIQKIIRGGYFDKIGLKSGDEIIKINGVPASEKNSTLQLMDAAKLKKMTLIRNKKTIEIKYKIHQ